MEGVRVLHSCTSESFSGLEGYVLELATWQYRNARNVELFCREGTELCELARQRGIPVWTIARNAQKGPLLWLEMRAAWRERLRAQPVVLHMHAGGEPWFHLPWLMARPRKLVKTILQYHIWINHKKHDPIHFALYSRLDEIWCSSESARAHLTTLLPVNRDRFRVIPYGRDVTALHDAPVDEWRRETRARYGVGDNDLLALCVSRFEKIKGVRELFDAFVSVAPRHPKAHLILVGDASPSNIEAKVYAEALKRDHATLPKDIRDRLHLPGFVSPCEPLMAASDFYVLPSYEECMSLAMLDAAILGRPVLGTSSGGTPSIARPDETGWLVPPADSQALAKALDRAFNEPAKIHALGRAASDLASRFDKEKIFHQIWSTYLAPTARLKLTHHA